MYQKWFKFMKKKTYSPFFSIFLWKKEKSLRIKGQGKKNSEKEKKNQRNRKKRRKKKTKKRRFSCSNFFFKKVSAINLQIRNVVSECISKACHYFSNVSMEIIINEMLPLLERKGFFCLFFYFLLFPCVFSFLFLSSFWFFSFVFFFTLGFFVFRFSIREIRKHFSLSSLFFCDFLWFFCFSIQ